MNKTIKLVITPFQAFVRSESAGGLLLVITALIAFLWANSRWAGLYDALKHFEFGLGIGTFALRQSLLHWVNDGLMAIFFLLVGLEIKREVIDGELSTPRAATLPVLAALGGMLLPAVIYAAINRGGPGLAGWGIPMATDIAFALGIMALLGKRIPQGLKVFLTALAIADDLGAVIVIAVFYNHGLHWPSLVAALVLWGCVFAYGWRGGSRLLIYALFGVAIWFFMLRSGVHATVAGILLALALPMNQHRRDGATAAGSVSGPLYRLEHLLTPWVAYAIVPIFALLNAGFSVAGEAGFTEPVTAGALLGLLLGKPIGVLSFTWIAVKFDLVELPPETGWTHMLGAAVLAGIGFTMSLFVADLAFGPSALLDYAKLGVLAASVLSAVLGLVILMLAEPARESVAG